jgi:hypothetical protein
MYQSAMAETLQRPCGLHKHCAGCGQGAELVLVLESGSGHRSLWYVHLM